MPETKLEPCPFCGAAAEQDYMQGYCMYPSGKIDRAAAIYCANCSAHMVICRADTPEFSDEGRMAMLVEDWNHRAANKRLVAEIATLREENERLKAEKNC